jgi:arylsulfatase A-like enzyme
MGLVKQIDDQLGRLFEYLESSGRMRDTLIVFTSDHGDYLGDHWLGEKELFHEPSVRVPLIIYDPDPAADGSRGQACQALVEAIDLVPTFLDALEINCSRHRLEGLSLVPFLRGPEPVEWRAAVFSEIDYAAYQAREALSLDVKDCRAYMLRTDRWKYVHFKGFRPQLFDLIEDPNEFVDLGASPSHQGVRQQLHEQLLDRLTDRRNRVTVDDEWIRGIRARERQAGIIIGKW